jgi:formiminoglutamase
MATASALDDSRLGNHVKSIELTGLGNLPHGFVIVGFADETGVRNVGGRLGAAMGPSALRQKLYKFTTGAPLLPVYDLGDLLPLATIEETHRAGALIAKRIFETGHLPIVIGGGHDLGFPHALGLIEARPRQRWSVFNLDAHLDLRPTTHGITSGSPWFLLRENPLFQKSKSRIVEFGLQPHCNAHVLVEYAKRHKIEMHWLEGIRESGCLSLLQKLIKKHSASSLVVVSFDIDSVQWSDAPGCSAPQTLGFTAAEAVALARLSGKSAKVKSFGLFELSPALDREGQTATLAAHCIKAFLEGKGAWNATRKK